MGWCNSILSGLIASLGFFVIMLLVRPLEAERITGAVKKKGVEVLGGHDSNAYRDDSVRSKTYRDIYRDLKVNFDIPEHSTYKLLKRRQVEQAADVIMAYEPPLFLRELISDTNAQIVMDVE